MEATRRLGALLLKLLEVYVDIRLPETERGP
jgi:hypothetical protein